MDVAYLGTSAYAVTVLRRLAASPHHRPALVVAPPDRRQGRGRRVAPPPVALAAAELGIELHQTESVSSDESRRALAGAGIELGLVCAFGQLIKPPLLDELELLNVHPSLLPRWRGAAPIERAIMAGDEETGVTIMRLDEGLDSGPLARGLQERVAIGPVEGFASLEARLAELGGELAVRALDLRGAGRLELVAQGETGVTYAEKIESSERRLDPSRPAVELERKVRALAAHVGVHLLLEDEARLGVVRAAPASHAVPAGELREHDGALLLGCAGGSLRIEAVRPPGKREMSAADYLRGHAVPRLAA